MRSVASAKRQDRVNSDKIALSHEYLAMMLGARRSGVTIAAASLQQAGFIRYARGKIVILDRKGLENAACECYAVAREQFQPLLGMSEFGASKKNAQRGCCGIPPLIRGERSHHAPIRPLCCIEAAARDWQCRPTRSAPPTGRPRVPPGVAIERKVAC